MRTWIDYTVDVETDVHTLSALLSDIDGWPAWTPGLHAIRRRPDQPLAKGTRFTMALAPGPMGLPKIYLPCQVFKLEPHCIEWGGGIGSSRIRHRFELTPVSDQCTRLRHVEYATGILGLLARPFEAWADAHDRRWSEAIRERFAAKTTTASAATVSKGYAATADADAA